MQDTGEAREWGGGPEAPVILIVDDEPAVLEVCAGYLADLPCRVALAGSCGEALALLESEAVDVLVSDYSMPEMSGVELLKVAQERWPETTRLLITGVADMQIAEQALNEGGAFRFLFKPVRRDTFRSTLTQALEYRRLREESRRYRREMEQRVACQARDLDQAQGFVDGLLEALPAGVLSFDAGGRVTLCNAAAAAVLELPEERLLGSRAGDLGLPCGEAGHCTLRGTPELPAQECLLGYAPPGGGRRFLLWSCRPLDTAEGRTGCVASFVDVTERKALEAAVSRGKQEIEAVFNSITDPTFVVDRTHTVRRANRALARLIGRVLPEVLGAPCREVLAAQGMDCSDCPLERVLEDGQPGSMQFRRPDGGEFRASFFPLGEDGQVEGAVVRYQALAVPPCADYA